MTRRLTPRQLQVLRAYVRTGSVKVAAYQLGVRPRTVEATLARARTRRGVDATVQLVAELAQLGELELDR